MPGQGEFSRCRIKARCLVLPDVQPSLGRSAKWERFGKVYAITSEVLRVVMKQLQNLRSEGQKHVAGADSQVG
jgi:hypothetical protein